MSIFLSLTSVSAYFVGYSLITRFFCENHAILAGKTVALGTCENEIPTELFGNQTPLHNVCAVQDVNLDLSS